MLHLTILSIGQHGARRVAVLVLLVVLPLEGVQSPRWLQARHRSLALVSCLTDNIATVTHSFHCYQPLT